MTWSTPRGDWAALLVMLLLVLLDIASDPR